MAQLERKSDSFKNPKSPNRTTIELLQGDERVLSPYASPNPKCFDQEEAFPHQQNSKKSVLTKVKEKAKKLRHSLSGNRRKPENPGHGENSTPAWGVSLEDEDDDDEDEDPEYLGAPMYESELAPEACKETARQHPRADPMFSEKSALPNIIKHGNENENEDGKDRSDRSDATQSIKAGESSSREAKFGENAEGRKDEQQHHGMSSPTNWDKGVSVKEYFMNKLEPGEDEKALSKVISEAMSPRKAPGEIGVVEKVKEVVTSFLRPQEPTNNSSSSSSSSLSSSSSSTNINPAIARVATSTPNSTSSPNNGNASPIIPVSTNPLDVCDEQAHGRILQTN